MRGWGLDSQQHPVASWGSTGCLDFHSRGFFNFFLQTFGAAAAKACASVVRAILSVLVTQEVCECVCVWRRGVNKSSVCFALTLRADAESDTHP